jgi:hypothetical protein
MWAAIFEGIAKGAAGGMNAQAGYQDAMLQSGQAEYDASQAEQQGIDQASLIRRVGRRVVGSQRAGYAGAGVKIGEGSAQQLESETYTDTEHDAYTAILNGQRQAIAIRTQSQLARIHARSALTSSLIDPLVASGMNSGGMSGWKTYNPSYQGQAKLNAGNSYLGIGGNMYANNDLSGTTRGSGD